MSDTAAYALKDNRDLDSVGAVFVNDTTEVNVRERLEQGDGRFVVTDPACIAVLDAYEPIKRVQVEPETREAIKAADDAPDSLDGLNKTQLLALPEAIQIENADRLKVDDLRTRIADIRQED